MPQLNYTPGVWVHVLSRLSLRLKAETEHMRAGTYVVYIYT